MARRTRYVSGDVKDNLTVLSVQAGRGAGKSAIYSLLCKCGNETKMTTDCLIRSKTCGCSKRNRPKVPNKPRNIHWMLPKGDAAINMLFRRYERGAEKRNLSFELKRSDFVRLIFDNCFYCGTEPCTYFEKPRSNGAIICNGVDRYDNNKGYTLKNSVTACKACNLSKNNRHVEDFINHAARITEFQNRKNISCLSSQIC